MTIALNITLAAAVFIGIVGLLAFNIIAARASQPATRQGRRPRPFSVPPARARQRRSAALRSAGA